MSKRVTVTVVVEPWVGPFVTLFVRLGCGLKAIECTQAYARRFGVWAR